MQRATTIDLGHASVTVELDADTGMADIVQITDAALRARVTLRCGSFDEVADQVRRLVDYARDHGWITPDEARGRKAKVTRAVNKGKQARTRLHT